MRLSIVYVRWVVEGWLVHSLCRLTLLVGCGVATAVVGWILWWIVASLAAQLEAGAVERRWAEMGRPFASFVGRYPQRGANDSAVRLERLAGTIGIDLVPAHVDGRPRPDRLAVDELKAPARLLRSHARRIAASDRTIISPLDPEAMSFLERHAETLSTLVDLLILEEPPEWEQDLALSFKAPTPNLKGHIHLTRILTAWSAQLGSEGRTGEAGRVVEAAWRLYLSDVSRPELLSQLLASAELRMVAGAARNHPDPPAHWPEMLMSPNPMARLMDAFQGEAWFSLEILRAGGVYANTFEHAMKPALHRGMILNAESLRATVAGLPEEPFATFDAGRGFAVAMDGMARQSIVARLALVDVWASWARVGRGALCAELSAEAIRLRRQFKSGGASGLADPANEVTSTVFPSVTWLLARDSSGVLIEPSQPLPAVGGTSKEWLCSGWYEDMPAGD